MSSLRRGLVFLILQFLDDEKFKETVHKLEQESGFFFNVRYFEQMITGGEWEEVEKYLSCFTKVEDNKHSFEIFFEIRKQKYFEALDKQDRAKALEILMKDLKVFAAYNEDIFKEICMLLTLDNIRDNEKLSNYDTRSARGKMLAGLKKLFEVNPLFHDKLQFPTLKNSRLRTLINQSLNWQHMHCENQRPNPDIKTLFVDHSCGQPIGAMGARDIVRGSVYKIGDVNMSSLDRDLVFLILQFLEEKGFKETAHKLEQESGVFFNMRYFEDMITGGKWEEVEKYLSCFTKADNIQSAKIFFAIRKQKFCEALDKPERAKALEILDKDLRVLEKFDEERFKDMARLLIFHNVRDNKKLSENEDLSASPIMLTELKELFNSHAILHDKLQFPTFKNSRLHTLINQSLNWQHQCCENGGPNFDIKTLFVDHSCGQRNDAMALSPVIHHFMGDVSEAAAFPPQVADKSSVNSRIWELAEINEPSQCRSLRLPDNLTAASARVSRLTYTNAGNAILALASNAVHKLWKWPIKRGDLTGKASVSIAPLLLKPASGILMTNDISDTNPEDVVPCFALSKTGSHVFSASGGKVSLFNVATFEKVTIFMPPPPVATCLAHHPRFNNIVAIGMDDSSIQIYNFRDGEVITRLKGHKERITGLAFSNYLNVLVSSGADSQLCVWSIDGWEKQVSKFLQMSNSRTPALPADTRVQFHADQTHLLAIHKTQIAVYETPKLDHCKEWFPGKAREITHATYSCDGELIYASFKDGRVCILTASTLQVRCQISPDAYLPPGSRVYPLVVAAHPSEPSQFALGLSDGNVYVLEPSESEDKQETSPPIENVARPSAASGAAGSDQPQQ